MVPRFSPGQVIDDGRHVGVGGADGYAEAGGDLHERVVRAQADQAGESPPVRRQLAATASQVTMSIVTHSTSA